MKPYAFNDNAPGSIGCCPGHDWPRTHRWAGSYSSAASARTDTKEYRIAVRQRRRTEKQRIKSGKVD